MGAVSLGAVSYERYEAAFGDRDAPFAFVDLDAMWANADDMVRRAGGRVGQIQCEVHVIGGGCF